MERNGVEVDHMDVMSSTRVPLVKIRHKFRCKNIIPRFPGVVFNTETLPLDQVMKLPVTAGTGWCFPGKNTFPDRFCVSKRVFPMGTQKVFLKEKSKKHVICFSDVSHR